MTATQSCIYFQGYILGAATAFLLVGPVVLGLSVRAIPGKLTPWWFTLNPFYILRFRFGRIQAIKLHSHEAWGAKSDVNQVGMALVYYARDSNPRVSGGRLLDPGD